MITFLDLGQLRQIEHLADQMSGQMSGQMATRKQNLCAMVRISKLYVKQKGSLMLPSKISTTEVVYTFICTYIQQHHYAPSRRDIADGCAIGLATATHHLHKLVGQGRIHYRSGLARGLWLADSDER